MAINLCPADQEADTFYPKEEEVCDYFEWCASFLTVPPAKEGFISSSISSSSSACSSGPPSERSSPNVSPYSSPEQYQPPSPDVSMQYSYEPYQDEAPTRMVVPQVFQTINIGVVQQYPSMQGHNHGHSQGPNHSQIHNHQQVFNHSHSHTQRTQTHQITQGSPQQSSNSAQAVSDPPCKELLVIDHSKEVQKRKAVVLEVAQVGCDIPEFVFSPAEINGEEVSRVALRPSFQLPQSFYRNCYEMLRMRVPDNSQGGFEGYRVYVHQKLGYSGNAKRFKQGPDAGERAFILEGEILNQAMEPIAQCQACEEYFRDASRRILLIKNNVPIHIKSGEFQLQLKLMCCSSHHNSPFYFHFSLYDHMSKRVVMNSVFAVNVKQWKNMGSSGNKRRKSEDNR